MLEITNGSKSNLILSNVSEVEIDSSNGVEINGNEKGKSAKRNNRKMAMSQNLVWPNHDFSLRFKNIKTFKELGFLIVKARFAFIK